MAGDWIPMRTDLTDDPAVLAIAAAVGIDEFAVVGRLHRLWSWANGHLTDGHAKAVTVQWVDRYVDATGFAAAMLDAGWLRTRSGGIEFPLFDRWNSQGAKRRVTQNRSKQQVKSTGDADATDKRQDGDIACRQNVAQRREEKRREKKEENPPTPHGGNGTPTADQSTTDRPKPAESVPIPAALDTPDFRAAWSSWLDDRHARKKTVTERGAQLQLRKLTSLGPAVAIECIEEAVTKGWTGLVTDRVAGRPTSPTASAPKPAGETPMQVTMRILATMNADNAAKGRSLI